VKKSKIKREPAEEMNLLEKMLDSLVDVPKRKGILTRRKYEKRIIEKVKIK